MRQYLATALIVMLFAAGAASCLPVLTSPSWQKTLRADLLSFSDRNSIRTGIVFYPKVISIGVLNTVYIVKENVGKILESTPPHEVGPFLAALDTDENNQRIGYVIEV